MSEFFVIGKMFEEGFDYVVVVNGFDMWLFILYIDNLWFWKGEILYLWWYWDVIVFVGKVIDLGFFFFMNYVG